MSILVEGRVTNLWKVKEGAWRGGWWRLTGGQELEGTVKLVQGAAVLEIMHSLLGLVRSPVSRTIGTTTHVLSC